MKRKYSEKELKELIRAELARISEKRNINFNRMPLEELDKWVTMIEKYLQQ